MARKYQPKYWSKKGKFQKRYDELYETLVPSSGDAATEIGQILRFVSKIYYDIYNNGGCNLDMQYFKDAGEYLRSHCRGLNDIASELKVEDYVEKLRHFTNGNANDKENDEVVDVIVSYVSRRYYSEHAFENLIGKVEVLLQKLKPSPKLRAEIKEVTLAIAGARVQLCPCVPANPATK